MASLENKDWKKTSWTFEDGTKYTISHVLQMFKHHNVQLVPISEIIKIRTVTQLNPERVKNADLSYPILVVKNQKELYILDGNHRLQKSINQNALFIKVKYISL